MPVYSLLAGRSFHNDFLGPTPVPIYGEAAPSDSDRKLKEAPIGTLYVRKVDTTHVQFWVKVTDNDLAADWVCTEGLVAQYVTLAEFTDGGGTSGTLTMTADLPAGAYVEHVSVNVLTAFAGDTTALFDVGTVSDPDRFVAASGPDAFATGYKDGGTPSGIRMLTSDVTDLTVTVTSSTDFGAVSGGAAMIHLFYHI